MWVNDSNESACLVRLHFSDMLRGFILISFVAACGKVGALPDAGTPLTSQAQDAWVAALVR